MSRAEIADIVGVVLAGGRSQRMGGREKALIEIAGRPMLAHIVARLGPQVARLALNANGDPGRFAAFGLPVIADPVADYPGPLAGVLAGLRWAATLSSVRATHMATVSSDAPFIPIDLVSRLAAAAAENGGAITVAQSEDVLHPVMALWPLGIADALEQALATGERRVQRWVEMQGMKVVPFAPIGAAGHRIDPFFNVNTPADLSVAETLMHLLQNPVERP